MYEEESIYNLIPKDTIQAPKQPRYKSKHPSNAPPTATTFCLKTTSKPGIGNINGEYVVEGSNHYDKASTGTFGKSKGALQPSPTGFIKKGTGTIKLDSPSKFHYSDSLKKPAVPKNEDKPIMGLKTEKNFIVSNAVENILAAPKLPNKDEFNPLKKKTYGKVPKYVKNIKREIEDEYQAVRTMQLEEENLRDQQKFMMSDIERKELIESLKKKWEVVHQEYQQITHISKLDTIGLKRKKETCEKELDQLEKYIEKLSKNYIFVDTTPQYGY